MSLATNKNGVSIGTTRGLSHFKDDHESEQVYVYYDTEPTATHPIKVHGWQGWGCKDRLHLTRQQATELKSLLSKALDESDRWAP